MFLETKNVAVKRKGSSLSFPNLSINVGDSLLLLGPSGSGKTTLLLVLAGLLRPSEGQVFIDGQDLFQLPSAKRDHLRGQSFGFVFQTLHLLPSLTVEQNIKLPADMAGSGVENTRLSQLMKTLHLEGKEERFPDTLSQGEQQRAAIARAVYVHPKIIVADEPTSALDDENAQSVIGLLEEQAKETGAALLIATHDSRIKNRFKTVIHLENSMEKAA